MNLKIPNLGPPEPRFGFQNRTSNLPIHPKKTELQTRFVPIPSLNTVRALLETRGLYFFFFWEGADYIRERIINAFILTFFYFFKSNFCGTVLEMRYYIRVRVSNRARTVPPFVYVYRYVLCIVYIFTLCNFFFFFMSATS